ncbi:MAG: hypothetical protein KHX34_07860 [Clostridiales bacterium]|nr:hypothetical protein [Clostridiales bacterium]
MHPFQRAVRHRGRGGRLHGPRGGGKGGVTRAVSPPAARAAWAVPDTGVPSLAEERPFSVRFLPSLPAGQPCICRVLWYNGRVCDFAMTA